MPPPLWSPECVGIKIYQKQYSETLKGVHQLGSFESPLNIKPLIIYWFVLTFIWKSKTLGDQKRWGRSVISFPTRQADRQFSIPLPSSEFSFCHLAFWRGWGGQNVPTENVTLWYRDYFELKVTEIQQMDLPLPDWKQTPLRTAINPSPGDVPGHAADRIGGLGQTRTTGSFSDSPTVPRFTHFTGPQFAAPRYLRHFFVLSHLCNESLFV